MENEPYTRRDTEAAVRRWGKTLFRICFTILCNRADAEDAVQEAFIKYMTKAPVFDSEAYEKAWLIRVAANTAKNMVLFKARHSCVNIDEVRDLVADPAGREILPEVMKLPWKYKIVMDLFYIEGYRTREIAGMIAISETAVRKRLQTGRRMLKRVYEEGSELCEQGQLC